MDVLLIIDMQEGSFKNNDKHDLAGVVERINRLSGHVRRSGGKVIFVLHDGNEADDLVPHTPGWQVLSALVREEGDRIARKTTNDAFYRTELDGVLEQLGVGRLVISGWATDQCVDSTVRAAISRDYYVAVAADCHTVSDRPALTAIKVIEHHNGIWRHLITAGAPVEVVSAEELMG